MAGLGGGSGGGAGAIRAGRAYVEAYLDDSRLTRGLTKLEGRLKKAGTALAEVGGKIALYGGLSIAPLAASFVAFDDAMRAAGARTESTAAQLKMLTDHARELGRTTSFTATEVANLIGELGTAGFKPDQIVHMTKAVTDLARATGTDATESALILGNALNSFGMDASNASHVADLLAAAADKTAVTLTDLGYAFRYAAPDAHRMGVSMEDTVTALGVLGQMGIRGEMGGTTLRRLLSLTGAEAVKFRKIFGVAAKDAAGNALPLVDVLESAQQSLAKLGSADATAKLNEFFGILGITGAAALGTNAKMARELRTELSEVNGFAAKVSKQMDAGLGGSLRRLKGGAVDAAIALGGAMAPALDLVGRILRAVANTVSLWAEKNPLTAKALGGVTVAVVSLGAALFGLGVSLKVAAFAISMIAPVAKLAVAGLSMMLGVITALATPAGMLAVILGELYVLFSGDGWKEFGETAKQSWAGVVAAFNKGDAELAFQIIGAAFKLEWAKIANWWENLWESATDKIAENFAKLWDFFRKPDPGVRTGFGVADWILGGGLHGIDTWDELEAKVAGVRADAEKAAAAFTPVAPEVHAEAERARAERERKQREELDALKARLKALTDKALDIFEVGPMPRQIEIAPAPRLRNANRFLAGIPSSVRGAFAVPNARGMFGVGTGFERRQLNAAERTAKATETAVKVQEKLVLALSFK